MNLRVVSRLLGTLLSFLGAAMAIPLVISLAAGEEDASAFLIAGVITVVTGLVFRLAGNDDPLTHRESFIVVTLGWVMAALLGGLPFSLSGVCSGYVDAVFEAMSGVTTTGATVLSDLETLPLGILFWRTFLTWLGGMGFVVLSIAILPKLRIGGRELFDAEAPGISHERLTPRIRQTAATLWGIYAGLTFLQAILLLLGGMNLFDALLHAFSTVATGGFSTRSLSVGGFQSAYVELVILVFMVLGGMNFTLHYHVVRTGSLRHVWKNTECIAYLAILVVGTLIVASDLTGRGVSSLLEALRLAGFQVASITTTTGFTTANYDAWPTFSKTVLFALMFVGGSAGSTSGGVKVVRHVIIAKHVFRELVRLVHPRALRFVTLDGRAIDEPVVSSVLGFVLLYALIFVVGTVMVSASGLEMVDSATAVAAAIGNVGPGFGNVGPYSTYADLPGHTKIFLGFLMLVGRLEIYSALVLFLPHLWRRRTA